MGVNVKLTGENPIHMDVTGDATINTDITANGNHASTLGPQIQNSGQLGGGFGGGISPVRAEDLLGWFPFDAAVGNIAKNLGTAGSDATLVSGAVFSNAVVKQGTSSLHIPTASTRGLCKK
jgi:hypothetical protein